MFGYKVEVTSTLYKSIIEVEAYKKLIILQLLPEQNILLFVRSGHPSPNVSFRGHFWLTGEAAFLWSDTGEYVNVGTTVNSAGTHYEHFWGFSLRCLAIE